MFKFLKEKLKSAVQAFTKKVDAETKPVEKPKAEPQQRPKAREKVSAEKARRKKSPRETPPEVPTERAAPIAATRVEPAAAKSAEKGKKSFWDFLKREPKEQPTQTTEPVAEPAQEKPATPKGFFGKITEAVTKTAISESKFEELFADLEIALLESNVAFEVVEKIKADLKRELVEQSVLRGSVGETIARTLKQSIDGLFLEPFDVVAKIRAAGKPFVIAFVGVNGSGKTTTIAKFAHLCQQQKLRPVIAAGDTFRAAAIQQLEEHASCLGVKLIKQDYGADPAAVGYDAINYAKAHTMDVVLIDTAGRQHANTNLMEEMKKIIRVCKPDMTIFIGESITGNDCVEQAREFGDAVTLDGIILTKADVDERGGAFVSVSYITGKPILYVGMGQGYEDLKPFDKQLVMENLGIA